MDRVDVIFAAELRRNGRVTQVELADRVGYTPATAGRRLGRLLASRAVRLVTVVHPRVGGLPIRAQLAITVDGPAGHVAGELACRPAVVAAGVTTQSPEVLMGVAVADARALNEEISAVRLWPTVRAVQVFEATRVVKQAGVVVGALPPGLDLDEADHVIIEAMRRDGRIGYADLATRTGMSQSATRTRTLRLLDSGILTVTATVPGGASAVMHASAPDVADAVDRLARLSGVSDVLRGTGNDIVATLHAASPGGLLTVVEAIRHIPAISVHRTWHTDPVDHPSTATTARPRPAA